MFEIQMKSNILRLHENFIRWTDKLGDVRPAFNLFIPEFQRGRVGWIYAGRTVDGKRMQPLSPIYAVRKTLTYGNQPILIASGRLIRAIRGGEGWYQKIEKKSLTMGINLPYASYHQDGTSRMPQRNYFLTADGTLNKMDYAQLLQAMEGQINKYTEAMLNQSIVELARGK